MTYEGAILAERSAVRAHAKRTQVLQRIDEIIDALLERLPRRQQRQAALVAYGRGRVVHGIAMRALVQKRRPAEVAALRQGGIFVVTRRARDERSFVAGRCPSL